MFAPSPISFEESGFKDNKLFMKSVNKFWNKDSKFKNTSKSSESISSSPSKSSLKPTPKDCKLMLGPQSDTSLENDSHSLKSKNSDSKIKTKTGKRSPELNNFKILLSQMLSKKNYRCLKCCVFNCTCLNPAQENLPKTSRAKKRGKNLTKLSQKPHKKDQLTLLKNPEKKENDLYYINNRGIPFGLYQNQRFTKIHSSQKQHQKHSMVFRSSTARKKQKDLGKSQAGKVSPVSFSSRLN